MRSVSGQSVLIFRVVSALALVLLAFAHQPIRPAAQPYAAAYSLPDGSFADLCFGVDVAEADQGDGHDGVPRCEACRLSLSVLLPVPDDGRWLIARDDLACVEWAPAVLAATSAAHMRPPVRGPPLIV